MFFIGHNYKEHAKMYQQSKILDKLWFFGNLN